MADPESEFDKGATHPGVDLLHLHAHQHPIRPPLQPHPQPPPHPQQQSENNDGFNFPPRPTRRARAYKEDHVERKERYDRMEGLTRELSFAVRDEMARRKNLWETEGDREEEKIWESRKNEIYSGLGVLSDEIQRAFRDRSKEAVMDIWSKEQEERRFREQEGRRSIAQDGRKSRDQVGQRSRSSPRNERGRDESRRDDG